MRAARDGTSEQTRRGSVRTPGFRPADADGSLCHVDAWIWGAVVFAIVLVFAGGVAWWLARGCVLTMIGATGAIVGGVVSLISLAVLIDPEAGLRSAAILTIGSGIWLLAWALVGGIRGQRLLRTEEQAAARPAPLPEHAGI